MPLWRLVEGMEEGENDLFLSPSKDPASLEGLHEFFLGFQLEKRQRNTFPCGVLPAISQNICSLHTPPKGILCTPAVHRPPYPSTSIAEPALQQMALSLQTMCAFRNSALSSTKHSQGHNRLLRRRFVTPSSPIRHGHSE